MKRIFMLVGLIALLNSCEKVDVEPSEIIQEAPRVRLLTSKRIPDVVKHLKQSLGLPDGDGPIFGANAEEGSGGLHIDWDRIMESITDAGKTNYVFGIEDGEDNPFVFYNLVLRKNELGKFGTPFLLKYEMAEEFIQEYLETGSMENFKGNITRSFLSAWPDLNNQTYSSFPQPTEDPTNDDPNDVGPEVICEQELISTNNGDSPDTPDGGYYTICEYFLNTVTYTNVLDCSGDSCIETTVVYTYITVECHDVGPANTSSETEDCPEEEGDIPILPQDYPEMTKCEKLLVAAFPETALRFYENSKLATFMTVSTFGQNGLNDCSDAYRHTLFNAINTITDGASLAKKFGDAHECENSSLQQAETEMDLFNNSIGRQIATANPDADIIELSALVVAAMQNGELKILEGLGPGNVSGPSSYTISSIGCN